MSIMRQMKDKAIAMAEAMAERARSPQDIEAARQRLVAEIQSGRVPAYVGVPLVQDLTQRLTQAKAQMAQQVAGMGVPQAPQGAPIAQQVMQQAQPAGVEALPSNLPTSYAPGGLVAFEEGGQVERYQNTGLVGGMGPLPTYSATNPNAAFVDFLRKMGFTTSEFANASPAAQKNITDMFRSGASATQAAAPGAASPVAQTAARGFGSRALGALTSPFAVVGTTGLDLSRGAANYLQGLAPEQREQLTGDIGSDTGLAAAILNAAKPPAGNTPTAADLGPVPGTQGSNQILGGRLRYADMPDYQSTGAPGGAQPGAGAAPGIAMPKLTLPTFTPTAAPALTDLSAIVKELPKESKTAFEDARKAEEDYLRGITKPGEEAREKRFSAREAALEKDSAMGRALNLMSLGFGIAGSKERTLAGALGNEGRQGIQALIQGEAANRVAKERLEDARDNFEQQKMAAKKGDRAAANAAGQRAAEDVRAYGQLNLQAAQAGNTQAQQRWHTENSLGFQGAQLQQQGVLGLANLNLEGQKLAQTVNYQNKLLAQNEKKIEASNALTRVRAGQVRATALAKFDQGPGMQLMNQLATEYGKNWRTAQDPRSLQAQMLYQQARQAYLIDALGQHELMDTGTNARPAESYLD